MKKTIIEKLSNGRGRPAKYGGMNLFRTELAPKFRPGTLKDTSYRLIKYVLAKGMKYESYTKAGGTGKGLDDLIKAGFIEAS